MAQRPEQTVPLKHYLEIVNLRSLSLEDYLAYWPLTFSFKVRTQ